jgi:cytochrome c556
VCLVACLTIVKLVSADPLDPKQAIEMRQQGFKDMGAAFKGVRDQFRRSRPVMVMLREYSRPLERYANEPILERWFPVGSGPELGIETEALPVIWDQFDDFSALWHDYVDASGRLQTAVRDGDIDTVRLRAREMGDTCSSCHDRFRKDQ